MILTIKRTQNRLISESEYKTGYKKPPLNTQFKKGVSGNPAGRPKGDKNSMSILKDILEKDIDVRKNGEPSRVKTLTAIWMQLVNSALKGNLKAVGMVLSQVSILDMKEEEREKVVSALTKDDEFIINNFFKRKKEMTNEQK
ncbi:MAG: DUF5681 domain-containing protein [Elusimicrobia bacterium]|nr:DUF5681 domain-containing protein [Elusimicrobiota bacterium]